MGEKFQLPRWDSYRVLVQHSAQHDPDGDAVRRPVLSIRQQTLVIALRAVHRMYGSGCRPVPKATRTVSWNDCLMDNPTTPGKWLFCFMDGTGGPRAISGVWKEAIDECRS